MNQVISVFTIMLAAPFLPVSDPGVPKIEGELLLHCRKMLDMQKQISIKDLRKQFENNAGKKFGLEEQATWRKLVAREGDIIREATKVIEMLESNSPGLAFPEAFRILRADMRDLQRRLRMGDVSIDTQEIEDEIIDSLNDIIRALEPICPRNWYTDIIVFLENIIQDIIRALGITDSEPDCASRSCP